ncbi:MAG TPA: UPF0236 family protein [Actinomycetota bacterium]|nr:UPF0236 family protein [Actinomycetota bacterium]
MRTLTVTVEVPWPKGPLTLAKLERAIHRAAMAAGRKALVQALGTWEDQILPSAGARQRRVRRYLLTRLGPIRFHRWKTRKGGRYSFPLDRAMGLRPWQTCSAFVWERACCLGAEFSFRTAAKLLSNLLGGAVDHRVLWRLVQKAGALRRRRQERVRSEMFEEGLAPPEPPGDPPQMVVTEVDGVVLRRQRPRGTMEARLAVAYTGKQIVSATARHRKRVVTGKVVVAGLWEEGQAGQVIYAWLSRSVGVHRARHLLVSGDGAEWIPVLVRNWFPDAVFQLDHYHLKVRLRQVAGDSERASRWIAWALQGQWRRVERSMAHLVARGRLDPKVAQETRAFLERGAPAIWAFQELRRQGAPAELCTRGSGVVEHTIDLQVARRMKRQGMFWSREGANNMLALRALLADPAAWRAWWKEVTA